VPQLHAASPDVARPIRNDDSTEKIPRAMTEFFASALLVALTFHYAAEFVLSVFPGRPLLVTSTTGTA